LEVFDIDKVMLKSSHNYQNSKLSGYFIVRGTLNEHCAWSAKAVRV